MTSPSDIRLVIFSHFQEFFKDKNSPTVFSLNHNFLAKLKEPQKKDLVKDFSEAEIRASLFSSHSNKAPGPDGLMTGVLKATWEIIKQDVLITFKNFHDSAQIPPGINSSFLVFIPKKHGPEKVSDYRPISLINNTMKLHSKVMAVRLSKVLTTLISTSQCAFIRGRQISDCILVANEVIHHLKSKKASGLIFKLL